MDSFRKMVQALRLISKATEKDLGLSTAQVFVLQKLAESEDPLSINELATATLTHQSSVSVVASKLINRNLVDRCKSEVDSRRIELTINKHGKYLLGKSPASFQDLLIKGLEQLTDQELKGLTQGLQALVKKSGLSNGKPSMLLEENGASFNE